MMRREDEIPPLDKMIRLWQDIEHLHFEIYVHSHAPSEAIAHDSRLYTRAQAVVAALVHYKVELER